MGSFLRGISVGAGAVTFTFAFANRYTAFVVGMVLTVVGLALSLLTRD